MIRYRNGAYVVTVYVGQDPVTGRERRKSRSVRMPKQARTPSEVKALEGKLLAEVGQGLHGSPKLTVGDLLDRWTEHVRGDLSPATLHGYEQKIRLYLRPELGSIRLDRLQTAQIDRTYRTLRDRGLAPATIRQAHAVLRRALHQAQRWGWIHANPAALAAPPSIRREPMRLPDTADLTRLLDGADDDLGDLIALAMATGLRRGELCALRWTDVDLDTRELTVARTVVDIASRLTYKAPKSGRLRKLAVGPNICGRLRQRRARMVARAARFGATLAPDGFVFADGPDGREPLHPHVATDRFSRHARRLGIVCRLHDLRHAAVTRALAAGIPVKDVSAHVGHESAKMTLDVYAHAIPAEGRRIADALDLGPLRDELGE